MAQIIHTIEVIPPEITPEARAAIEGGRPFHIELQELAETEREKKRKTKNNIKSNCKDMRHIEDRIQEACVSWFDLQFPKLSRLLHHSPNGGKRNPREGARFKAMGTRAGFPDLILLYPAAGYHALLVEMKTKQRGSKQTESQKNYQRLAEAYGYKYIVCRSFDEFRTTVITYLTKETQ